ncbi:hypothetical protein AAFF_G00417720 [Aldrovandia affinis]|uniref:Microsomal glutathione S-transferase 1 n=1 Tax=Aldrovandia affinis TaxID=143900 RepID=A0AAD7WK13_9TELE|nr:hypothetical protein AAFF_G00417720 [Aldrovandia affinis]
MFYDLMNHSPRVRAGRQGEMAEVVHMIDSEVFLAFSTYATIVILKMMLMSLMTSYFRMTRKVFANLEDTGLVRSDEDKRKMVRIDPDVERVRRCHQNDLENVVPFVLVGLLYALTGPDLQTALLHFRVFVVSRFLHTVVYVTPLPQPSRVIVFLVGLFTTLSMAYRVTGRTVANDYDVAHLKIGNVKECGTEDTCLSLTTKGLTYRKCYTDAKCSLSSLAEAFGASGLMFKCCNTNLCNNSPTVMLCKYIFGLLAPLAIIWMLSGR